MKEFDVIIIGAGVSGLMLTKFLDKSKLKVLLIEKNKKLKDIPNHQYGTFKDTCDKFDLYPYVIKKYDKFGFHTPNNKADFNYESDEFFVVEMHKFIDDFKLKNVELMLGCEVTGFERKDGVAELHDDKNNFFRSKIVVDCSGYGRVVARLLGYDSVPIDMWDKAYLLDNCKIPYDDRWLYIADNNYANEGFWYYPLSKKKCIIGHTDFVSDKILMTPEKEGTIDYFIRDVEPYKSWFKNAKILEEVKKIGPTTTLLPSIVEDNVIFSGDASGAGTPLVGEGFRVALEMAASANEAIAESFSKDDFSKKGLELHEKNFNKVFGKYYIWSNVLRFLPINFFTNREWDLFGKNLRAKMDDKLFLTAFRSEINFKIFLKCVSFKLLFFVFFNMIKYVFTGFKPLNKRVLK